MSSLGWFFKHSLFVSHHVSAKQRDSPTLSLHLAVMWCDTNEECVKKPIPGDEPLEGVERLPRPVAPDDVAADVHVGVRVVVGVAKVLKRGNSIQKKQILA